MGNGSIKGPRMEESCLASAAKEPPLPLELVESLKGRIRGLEEELRLRDERLGALEKELQSKVSQIDKLQDALGYNSLALSSPRVSPSQRLLSVINEGPKRFQQVAAEVHRRLKAKEGVSAEPTSRNYYSHNLQHFSFERARVGKDSSTKKLINEAIMNNDFLKKLDPQHTRDMVECMYEKTYQEGQLVIQEGEPGNHLYVLAEGLLEVIQNNKLLGQMHAGTAFGELAVLYNCKRTATVKAVTHTRIWVLDRQISQNIMMRTAKARHEEYFSFLRSVSLLRDLPEEKLAKIIDCLEVDYYDKGEYIIREGEEGNTFFIIAVGEVCVTQTMDGSLDPQEIKTLGVGDYFGEKALISEDVRSANIIANENDTQCLVVDRDTFNQMVGTYEELQTYLKEYVEQLSRSDEERNAVPLSPLVDSEVARLMEKISPFATDTPFQHLEIIATLGMGGFGRVELVKLRDEDTAFALKCIKKKHIVESRQQEHIYSEKNILQQSSSPFIVKMFRTFRDKKYVYMLLEACLGGELWSILRDMCFFEEPSARFCIGCVLEAFSYLHGRGIVYRDLKPENLLLDKDGYVKMVDFGFAKRIGLGKKTWTFCGTPEYVAPEIIMNKGHDFGADYWSLGILIFELLTGSPPFSGSDPIKIYSTVLRGIEKVDFPKRIGKRPEDLIRRLCKWFQGFNWEGLRSRKLSSPLRRELHGPLDHSNFDTFPPELDEPVDELSGWDRDF